jgi:protocatechuate 3,4-dioxygenase beta subunit
MGAAMVLKKNISRRRMLKISGITLGALGASSAMANSLANICESTPRQPEGPFYPVRSQADTNRDLTKVDGKSELAAGEIIYLSGKVTDQNCLVVKNVVVEIWQACVSGKYDHPGDAQNPNPLDPNFQYWGITTTNDEGEYFFKTIIPGHYNASATWVRPPHIHFKIHKRGYHELITQMYFLGNRYNDGDRLLASIPQAERAKVIRPKIARSNEGERVAYDMNFDIGIRAI